jgi:hypothetical protein
MWFDFGRSPYAAKKTTLFFMDKNKGPTPASSKHNRLLFWLNDLW